MEIIFKNIFYIGIRFFKHLDITAFVVPPGLKILFIKIIIFFSNLLNQIIMNLAVKKIDKENSETVSVITSNENEKLLQIIANN